MSTEKSKQDLILAHAARRQKIEPIQKIGLWAGVITCVAFVGVIWVYTVGMNLSQSLAKPLDGDIQQVLRQTKDLADMRRELQGAGEVGQRLLEIEQEVSRTQEKNTLVTQMVQQISTSSTGTASSTTHVK